MKNRKVLGLLIEVLFLLFLQSCILEEMLTIQPMMTSAPTSIVTETETIVTYSTKTTVTSDLEKGKCVVSTGLETGNLFLRICGSMSCAVVTVLNEGDELDNLHEEHNGWKKVQLSGKVGWVFGDYVEDCK